VASRDGQTVAGHIGKCAEWIIFEAEAAPNSEHPRMEEVARIMLPKDLVFHYYKDDGPHPLADYVRQHVTPPKPRPIGDLICKLRDSLTFGK
ncbi:MAG: hypothetical protein ACU85E_17165, partial [Gammaproteobacteria bacterium]